jgi:hypothetical protein
MRKTLILLTVALLAFPALARHQHNRAFVCGESVAVDGTKPLFVFDQSQGEWCPAATINDDGVDVDICIEGDTDAALLCTNAGLESVGIGTATPATGAKLEVDGIIVPDKVTADPCSSGAPEGGIFYNDTSNVWCGCNGTDDVRLADNTTACF